MQKNTIMLYVNCLKLVHASNPGFWKKLRIERRETGFQIESYQTYYNNNNNNSHIYYTHKFAKCLLSDTAACDRNS